MRHTICPSNGAATSTGRASGGPARHWRTAVPVAAFVLAVVLSACGGGDPRPTAADGPSGSPQPATTDPTPATTDSATEPGAGGERSAGDPSTGSSNGGRSDPGDSGPDGDGDGDGGDQPGGPANEPPYFADADVEAYFATEEGDQVLVGHAYGHAYDPDGLDDQERVDRIRVQWDDGTTTTARLEGHGAFRAHHEYDPSYRGRSVTVRIVAHGHDGGTATETFTLDLPE